MDLNSLSISVPMMITLAGTFIGIMSYFGNKKKVIKEDTEKETTLWTKMQVSLENIDNNTKTLTTRVDKHDTEIHQIDTRVSVLEDRDYTKKGRK